MKQVQLVFLLLLASVFTLEAHQPDYSSLVMVEQEDGSWLLNMRAALTGFEYTIHDHFGKDSYTTPEEFEDLVIDHIKKEVSILVNDDKSVSLRDGVVRLGHETQVYFTLDGMPEELKNIKLKNTFFADIHNNQCALVILKKGIKSNKFTLDKDNNHSIQLTIVNDKVLTYDEKNSSSVAIWASALFVISIILAILAILWKTRKEK